MKRNSVTLIWSILLLLIVGVSHHVAYAAEAADGKQAPPADYRFDLSGKSDPFRPFVELDPVVKKKAAMAAPSIFPLQKIDLDEFTLIGIAGDADRKLAIVEAKDSKGSKFYTLALGTIIGLKKGKVVEIKNDSIVVEEATPLRSGKKINRIIKKLRKDDEGIL